MAEEILVTNDMGITLRPPVRIVKPTKQQLANREHLLIENPKGSGIYSIEGAVHFKRGESLTIIGDPGSEVLAQVADPMTGEKGPALKARIRAARNRGGRAGK